MAASSSSTGIFFIICFAAIAALLAYWMWAVNNRKRQARMLSATRPAPLPRVHSQLGRDPVNRMEAGENTDGLPKYTPQARIGEQTVDRNVAPVELNETSGRRPEWLSTRPSIFRQLTQLPSRPPPAYDPSGPRAQ